MFQSAATEKNLVVANRKPITRLCPEREQSRDWKYCEQYRHQRYILLETYTNMVPPNETIVAQITPPGCGAVAVVRISGPKVTNIATAILTKLPAPRLATHSNFFAVDHSIIDQGLVLFFPAPHSFTGEDVLELQGHGSQVVIDSLLQRIIELGARLAKPGEFSERAFLNNKIDLTQAEAIVDLINASTKEAASNAMRSLQGDFSKRINSIVARLTELRVNIEASIDFTEEDITFAAQEQIAQKLTAILQELQSIHTIAKQGLILREGMHAVITGKPNAGKSSLLNLLSGEDKAIVTAIPGTTRDVLHAQIQIDGLVVNLIDTAGLHDNPDIIEQEGIRRAHAEIKKASHILVLLDAATEASRDVRQILQQFAAVLPEHARATLIFNKIDLTGEQPQLIEQDGITSIYLSVKNGLGIDLLKNHLKTSAGVQAVEGGFSARRRHVEALKEAMGYILQVQPALIQNSLELVAENLHLAQQALGTIIGEFTSEDLLEKIFSEFCIGK